MSYFDKENEKRDVCVSTVLNVGKDSENLEEEVDETNARTCQSPRENSS